MITLKQIDKELFQSDIYKPEKNFVAAAVMVLANGVAQHSGIVISYDENYYLFHYTSEDVELKNVPDGEWYFHKILEFITAEEVLAFFAHCTTIKQNASPKFGCFYGGDYYKDGKYFSENGLKEFMTCVGFCINVVSGYLENNIYFSYTDWDDTSLQNPEGYFETFLKEVKLKNPGIKIDEKLFRSHLRRITPLEYTSSAYLKKIPITKAAVDKLKSKVKTVLVNKRLTNPINN